MKKTKIYLIVTILVFLLSIVLVACGDKPSQDTPTEQEKKYTVTFVVDGEDYFTLETSGKSAIELPSNPTKDGYEFVGWYFDVNVWLNPCNSTSFANENLTANVTVYARWELIKETYSVTFVGGTGATGDAPTMEAKAEGDKFDLPQNTFVKEDYDFDGWFDGQTKYAAGDEYVMPSYAVTFTAQWVLTSKYKVTFVGGEGAVGTDPEIEDKKEGEVITLPENPYTKEDYIFAGWSDGEKTYLAAATYTMPKKDVEFVAVWEYSKYIVSFDSRGGSDVEAAKVDKNGKLTAPKQPKRNGYLFSGWYKNEDCTTLWDFDVDKVKGNITLYAKWVVDAVGISSVEGATIDGNNILMVIEKDVEFVELAEKVILANTNAYWNLYYDRLGQTKIPTKIAANQTDGSLAPAENVFYILVTSENGLQEKLYTLTIYRRFTVNVKYYDKDDNLIVDKDDATLTSYKMDTFNTINVAYDKYSVIGYSFDGWDIIVDGERVPFVFGENGTNVLGNVNLYAHVTPLQYVATFTLGDGETLDVTSQTMTYDAQYTLPVPQKTGYTFKGWYYEKSYDYIYLSDGNGASSSVWTVAQDVELKADWSVNYYTVSIEKNYDGAGRVYGGGQRAYDSDCTISVQSTNLGYTFVGWYDGETLLTTENAYTFKMSTIDRSFAAKWEVNEEMQPFEFTSSTTSCTITGLAKSATEMVIPDYVTSIGDSAFAYYSSIKSITIPDSVKSIGKSAFLKCSGLTNIVVPDSVTSIGDSAFKYCNGLTSITLPFIGASKTSNMGYNQVFGYIFGYITNTSSNYGESGTTRQYSKNGTYYWYYIPSSIKTVIISDAATSIPSDAFFNCIGLTSVTIGNNVTSVGFYAFAGCSDLTSVTIGNGVTSIGDYAFAGCSGLTSITIPNSVTSIGIYAFQYCGDLKVYYTGDVASWCGISGLYYLIPYSSTLYIDGKMMEGELVIPDGVTAISFYAFYNCNGLTSVTIPSSVTSIGGSAFSGCDGLTSIYYTGDVASWCGISGLGNLKSSSRTLYIGRNKVEGDLVIPDSVMGIGDYAFRGCSSLTSVTIGNGVTSIGSSAFSGCNGLTRITGSANNASTVATQAKPATFIVNITNGTSIGSSAFSGCTGLTSITIPDSVTSIGDYAFYGCSGLTSVTIPDNVTSIGSSAFYGCTGLTSITIPDSVTNIGYGVFSGCSSLERITIPFVGAKAGVTSRDTYQYPFGYIFGTSSYTGGVATKQYYYGSSTSSTTYSTYYIPSSLKSVTVIGGNVLYGAFYNCSGLTSITIGNGVTNIGDDAFYGCDELTSIYYSGDVAGWCGIGGLDNLMSGSRTLYIGGNKVGGELVIPDGVTAISSYAFYNCSGLTSITIGNSVTSIGKDAFSGCGGLTRITGSANNASTVATQAKPATFIVNITNGTSIGSSAFSGCTGLTNITIPDSVTSIGKHAFSGCSGLTSVTIPAGVIGDFAFYGCSGLTSVTIGDGVTSIEYATFYGCTGLSRITIPDNVTSIDACSFQACSGLTSVTIGDGVTSIGRSAFEDCSGLTSVTIGNNVTSIGQSAFANCRRLVEVCNKSSLTITAGSRGNGDVAWYAKNVYTEEGGSKLSTDDKGYVIYTDGEERILVEYCGTATELVLPSGITEINQYAFYECSGLTSVTIPDSVTSIGWHAFAYCDGLTSITIPNSVTIIGDFAFYHCTELTRIDFQGTKEEWQNIKKNIYNGESWNAKTGDFVVYCTDGTISKSNA